MSISALTSWNSWCVPLLTEEILWLMGGFRRLRFKAAGVIPIVHASGGPLQDIVVPVGGQRTGTSFYLAP
jgi:hypothetical protein